MTSAPQFRVAWLVVGFGLLVGCGAKTDAVADDPDAAVSPDAEAVDTEATTLPVLLLSVEHRDAGDAHPLVEDFDPSPEHAGDYHQFRDGTLFLGRVGVIDVPPKDLVDIGKQTPTQNLRMVMHVRGNSSSEAPKKPYGLDLVSEMDSAQSSSSVFVGLPKENEFNLLACWFDKTCIRSALALELWQQFGDSRVVPELAPKPWSVRTRQVEVFLDGEYLGLYLLTESIKQDTSRLDLDAPAMTAADMDLITGDYLIQITQKNFHTDPRESFTSKNNVRYYYQYPSFKRVTQAQKDYLHKSDGTGYLDKFDDLVTGTQNAFRDPAKGYRAWIDVPSWVDYALHNEMLRNDNVYCCSQYLYKVSKARGGLLFMGPAWDYDLSTGATGIAAKPAMGETPAVAADDFTQGWGYPGAALMDSNFRPPSERWQKLWLDPKFRNDAKCRWNQLRKGPLDTAKIHARIDQMMTLLTVSGAYDRNQKRWPTVGAHLHYYNMFQLPTTKDEEVAYLKSWVEKRFTWMDKNMPGTCPP